MTPDCLAQGGNQSRVTATLPLPFPDPGVSCTQGECLDPPLSRTPVVAHRFWPPQVWQALTNPWGAPRGKGPRTLTGAQGGPEASAWTEKEAGPALDGPAHRWTLRTNQHLLRPAPTSPLGLSAAQSKERLARQANQKLAKRARRGKRTWPRVCGSRRGPDLMASRKHQ